MKARLFILTAMLFFIFNLKTEAGPKSSYLKKPVKLSDIQDLSEAECDLCGCYMGLEPNFEKNQVGLRYYSFKFKTEPHQEDPNEPVLDHHPTDAPNGSEEYYNNVELYGRFYFNPKFRLLFGIPFSFNNIDSKALNGVGDLRFVAQYNVYNTEMTGRTNFWQRIFLGGGMKFPTGAYNKQLVYGVTEPHFQPGTGSFDFIFTGLYIAKLQKAGLGWRNDFVYTLNTVNKNDFRFANRFNIASTFSYDIVTETLNFLPHAGIYFETANPDQQNGQNVEGSGGSVLFGTFGFDVFYKMISLDFDYQLPMVQNFIGEQAENSFRYFLSAGYSF